MLVALDTVFNPIGAANGLHILNNHFRILSFLV
jgi:hypothetical protein